MTILKNIENHLIDDPKPFKDVFSSFMIDASFLWTLRNIALEQPHYTADEVNELQYRVQSNLDGLMSSFELAWQLCEEELTAPQAGEIFTAAIIAFRSRDILKIERVVNIGIKQHTTFKALVSALGWLPSHIAKDWMKKFLMSKDLSHKHLALSYFSIRRKNPGDVLSSLISREDVRENKPLNARICRLIGELKLYAYANYLHQIIDSDDNPTVIFWGLWALIMLGEFNRVDDLYPYIEQDSSFQKHALTLTFSVLPIIKARAWISQLAKDGDKPRIVIAATAVLGDPIAIPWLIEQMKNIDTARVAGEAFESITGIDLTLNKLITQEPENLKELNFDDEPIELQYDENLPYPDVIKIGIVWQKYTSKFKAEHRYFMGLLIDNNNEILTTKLKHIINAGKQRQRHRAALTLALLDPQNPLINTKKIEITH